MDFHSQSVDEKAFDQRWKADMMLNEWIVRKDELSQGWPRRHSHHIILFVDLSHREEKR